MANKRPLISGRNRRVDNQRRGVQEQCNFSQDNIRISPLSPYNPEPFEYDPVWTAYYRFSLNAYLTKMDCITIQELSQQRDDSDIPTSEADLMPQYGTRYSKRMRARRNRLLKALHRLLLVESMHLGTPEEIGHHLCAIELDAKGLLRNDGDAVSKKSGFVFLPNSMTIPPEFFRMNVRCEMNE